MIKLSVIIPIYNVAKYLDQCLESVALQTGVDLEVILVNDGSTDRSGEIAKEYAERYKWMVYQEQPNRGLSDARNAGLRIASGKYVMFVDSDDYWLSDCLAEFVTEMDSLALDLLLFSGKKIFCDKFGDVVGIEDEAWADDSLFECGIEMFDFLQERKMYKTGVYYQIARAEYIKKNGLRFLSGILHEDHLYSFMAIVNSGKCKVLNSQFYAYRIRADSIMTSTGKKSLRFDGFAVSFARMMEYVGSSPGLRRNRLIGKYFRSNVWIALKYFIMGAIDDRRLSMVRLNELRKVGQLLVKHTVCEFALRMWYSR